MSATIALISLSGCVTRPPFLANADPALRKTSAQFSADAANRAYEADAPRAVMRRAAMKSITAFTA